VRRGWVGHKKGRLARISLLPSAVGGEAVGMAETVFPRVQMAR